MRTENGLTLHEATKIMVLSRVATWEDIVTYLEWLAESDYAYHIDDDPEDIWDYNQEVATLMRSNADILWSFSNGILKGENLWNVYGDAFSRRMKREDSDYVSPKEEENI